MSRNREIEAKTLLNKKTFTEIEKNYRIKNKFEQKNYYFDTPNEDLKQHNISFRIRIFTDHAEQTLKVPDRNPVQKNFHEVIEINDSLTKTQAIEIIQKDQKQQKIEFNGNVGIYLTKNFPAIIAQLRIFTWSKTIRLLAEGPQQCELTLDQTSYPDGYTDYELEIENPDPQLIHSVLKILESRFNFKQNKKNRNQNKIGRASLHRKK